MATPLEIPNVGYTEVPELQLVEKAEADPEMRAQIRQTLKSSLHPGFARSFQILSGHPIGPEDMQNSSHCALNVPKDELERQRQLLNSLFLTVSQYGAKAKGPSWEEIPTTNGHKTYHIRVPFVR